MKKTLFLLLAILYNTLFGFAQSSVNPKSSTLGLELPKGSKLEKDIAIIKKNSARLDSFAMKHDYKLSKGDAEVFYTDFELLTNTLRENQWVITQEADNEFYQIQKGKQVFLAWVTTNSSAFIPRNYKPVPMSFSAIFPFIISATHPFAISSVTIRPRARAM